MTIEQQRMLAIYEKPLRKGQRVTCPQGPGRIINCPGPGKLVGISLDKGGIYYEEPARVHIQSFRAYLWRKKGFGRTPWKVLVTQVGVALALLGLGLYHLNPWLVLAGVAMVSGMGVGAWKGYVGR